jgi:hypothetical protein
MDLVVAAVDVGSLANIGWWRARGNVGTGGHDLDDLVGELIADLERGSAVAVGFEAPLFIPRPTASSGLNKQRLGERGRPWCAAAGSGSLALGIQQSTYVLTSIAHGYARPLTASYDCDALRTGAAQLVVWEAFVTGKAKNPRSIDPHVDDASAAVAEFRRRITAGTVSSDIADLAVLNLAGAALLAAGLTDDVAVLTQPCTVVRAPDFAERQV